MSDSKKVVVLVSVASNLAVAAAKFAAAIVTHSSAMLSEGIHSLVDTGDGLLLLYGRHRASRPPDEGHPFGHGLELYFWSLIVAVMIFGAGGAVAVYEGILHIRRPGPTGGIGWGYAVLAASFALELVSWLLALNDVRREGEGLSLWTAMRLSKDPTGFVVLMENTADLLGIVVAAAGIALSRATGSPAWDGIASVIIGLLLCAIASFLIYETRGLMLGESVDTATRDSIQRIAAGDEAIEAVRRPLTMHFGPAEVLLNLDVQFKRTLTVAEVGAAVERLERTIRERHPEVRRIFVEARSFIRPSP